MYRSSCISWTVSFGWTILLRHTFLDVSGGLRRRMQGHSTTRGPIRLQCWRFHFLGKSRALSSQMTLRLLKLTVLLEWVMKFGTIFPCSQFLSPQTVRWLVTMSTAVRYEGRRNLEGKKKAAYLRSVISQNGRFVNKRISCSRFIWNHPYESKRGKPQGICCPGRLLAAAIFLSAKLFRNGFLSFLTEWSEIFQAGLTGHWH